MTVDLRSDTVTKPSKAMLEVMLEANVGDDVYKEDPTVNKLEHYVARMFGKDEALFFPSGTMANQTAIKLHTDPGDQVICDKYAHVYNYEGGGGSFNSGISFKCINGHRGMFTKKDVIDALNPPDFYHNPLTRLVTIENTTNKGGGACWDFAALKEIKQVCKDNQLGYHLDGARIWNALIENETTPKAYGQLFDTISVCFSKGLGCPIGSMLIGNSQIMKKAIKIRKILGGSMRQTGYLASAALYALEYHLELLRNDHVKAKELEIALKTIPQIKNIEPVETNIVIFELENNNFKTFFLNYLSKKDIKISQMGQGKLRIVTHMDYKDVNHSFVLNSIKNVFK